jgi:AraC-like DNA-binding protein
VSGLEAFLLLGCVHGLVLAIVVVRRATNRVANRYLATLLAAISLLLFNGYLAAHGTLAAHPHLTGFAAWIPFALGPLVFLYVREMTAQRGAPPWRHFVVTAAYILLLAIVFFPRSAAYKLAVTRGDASWLVLAIEAFLLVYGMTYVAGALVLLRRHRPRVQEVYSNLGGVSLRWLVVLVTLNALVWGCAIVSFALRLAGHDSPEAIVPLGSTITVFLIGYFQLGQTEVFVEAPPAAPAYQKARLPEDDAADLEAKITAAMTADKLYQRSGLTLGELADAVGATPHEVSQILSTRLGRNFYAYVNEHRVEHVKAALATSDRPILDLALEAGFQSKSTFNAAFRKATGMTPSDFRRRPSA